MLFDTLLNPAVVFNIGINFVEISLELMLFLFFFLNARKGKTEKGLHGTLSIRFSLSFLFLAIQRSLYILWDYIFKDSLIRVIAWIFMFLGTVFVMLVFYHVFDKYLPKLKLFLSIAIPTGATIFTIYFIFVFILQNTLFNLFIFASMGGLILFIPIYAFAKVFIEKGRELRKYIVTIMIGLLFLFFGNIIASLHGYINPDHSLTVKAVGHVIFVLGIILFGIGFWGIPSLKEIEWREKMRHLYLINEGGVNLYDQSFMVEEDLESDLIAGSISGISSLIQELTRSKERVEVIKQKDLKILLKYGTYVTVALIADEDLEILHLKLKMLIEEFESLFQYVLPKWKGDLDVFSPVKVMVERIFT